MLNGGNTMTLKEAITTAIGAHGKWKTKFREFMDGKLELDAATVQKNNVCDFGKWLEGDGKQALVAGDYQQIHRLHTEFHSKAASVISMKKTGDVAGAEKALALGGAFTDASGALTRVMMDVSKRAA
ncbi:MAG: hypothetical protein E8D51_04470 [Nitrospira sp.]|jgi:hypothetical protein|nr:MAG: hypothetical protein E8D51_04470 [Nitrospira sp.]